MINLGGQGMRKIKKFFMISLIVCILVSCSTNPPFITDDKGHKQYKDSQGNFIKNDWVEIKGEKYYFDLNGFLVTNQWVQDEYYVDEDGKMVHDFWYDDGNGHQYYLDENGKYVRDCMRKISGKDYAFDNNGQRIVNNVYIDEKGKGYYFDGKGNIDNTPGYKSINDTYCYVNDNGKVTVNNWVEDNGKWYYYGANGLMQKDTFVDDKFYVDINGEMVCNKELVINNNTYIFDSKGNFSLKQKKNISFKDLLRKHCYYYNELSKQEMCLLGCEVSSDDSTLEIKETFWDFFNHEYISDSTRVVTFASAYSNNYFEAIRKINADIGFPNSIVSKIKNSGANDGVQTESYNGVTLTWKVTNNNGYSLTLYCIYTK